MFVKIIIDEKLKRLHAVRKNSINDFIDYLSWSSHFGRIDQVYLSIKVLDKGFIEKSIELKENNIFKNLALLTNKINDGEYKDLLNLIINQNIQEVEVHNIFNKYFEKYTKKEAGYEENFILSFLINALLEKCDIDSKLAISLVNYFWKTKNCNEFRKSYCIFMINDYCYEKKLNDFFKLPKRWYSHTQKIYAKIYSTTILDELQKKNYLNLISKKLREVNKISSIKSPKIAVCISGLYRNHYSSLESIKQNIVDPLNADVFIHTWDEMAVWNGIGGAPSAVRIFGQDVSKLLPEKTLQNFHEISKVLPNTYEILKDGILKKTEASVFDVLKPKKIEIESQKEFEELLGDDVEGYTINRGTLNQIKMFYGIKKAIDMALDFSRYDFVIRLRPDIFIKNKLNIDTFMKLENNSLYAGMGDYGVTDTDFTISSSLAFSLSNLIEKMFEIKKISPYEDFPLYDAHNIFFMWMVENNINSETDLIRKSILNMIDVNIILPGLFEAIDLDLSKMKHNERAEILPFVNFLRGNYT